MRITIIHPSRSRPEKSKKTIQKWFKDADMMREVIVSLDDDDPFVSDYKNAYQMNALVSKNRSCVDAINNAAKLAGGDILMVVSDDTGVGYSGWDYKIIEAADCKTDWLLKTDDGIQDYIVTMTVMDRKYYERDGFIYHPDFFHQFADTYLTCLADIRGRLIKSDLKFPHNHYSKFAEFPDELHKRNDASWKEGQNTFVRLMKQFTPEERARIKDPNMRGFLRKFGL